MGMRVGKAREGQPCCGKVKHQTLARGPPWHVNINFGVGGHYRRDDLTP